MTTIQSEKTKLKTQTTGVIKNKKITLLLILIGVLTLIGDSAPYIHKAFPKKAKEIIALEQKFDNREISKETYIQKRQLLKEKYSVFGFSNMRRFLFAIGVALAVFCVASLFFISLITYDNRIIKKAFLFSAISFLLNGLYYIIWVFWDNNELPDWLYHFFILCIAILLTAVFYFFYKYITNTRKSVKVLRGNLDTLDRDIEFIKEIGWLMPDNKKYVTYKMLIDLTSDDLRETRKEIDKILGE